MTATRIPLQDIPIEVCELLGAHHQDVTAMECPMDEILAAVDSGIVINDLAGKTLYANDAARAMLEYAPGDAPPADTLAWYSEDGAALQPEDLPTWRVITTGTAHTDAVLRCVSLAHETRWLKISAQPLILRKTRALIGVVTAYSDVTGLKTQQEAIEQVAHFDPLTKLPNRRVFLDRIEVSLARISRRSSMVAVCFLDLDGFKAVNDTFGHAGGDRLLVEVAQRIQAALRGGDSVGRLGGDEFALLLTDINDVAECEQVLTRILQNIAQEVNLSENDHASVSASIGVALFPADGTDVTTLVRKADSAMYSAKRSGKNRYHLYDEELDRLADARRLVLTSMADALENGELRLWYQPKVNLTSGQIIGAEALVRWQHPQRGLLAPGEFLPEIERTDLVIRLGDWVIGEALAQGGAWRRLGLDLTISVNVAARQLQEQGFFAKLEKALAVYPAGAQSLLQLELIEAATLDEIDAIRTIMEKCKALGVRFAIDDFGTGQSSLNYFRHLPADTLKIDGSFVRAMMDSPDDYLLVRGIVAIAGAFNREVVAEGVATDEQSAALLAMGCRVVQGYAVARPMPAEEFVDWCASYPPDSRWRKLGLAGNKPAARRA